MGIIWGYKTHKRMPWTIRLAASGNSKPFTIHLRKKNSRSARNKQATKQLMKKSKPSQFSIETMVTTSRRILGNLFS